MVAKKTFAAKRRSPGKASFVIRKASAKNATAKCKPLSAAPKWLVISAIVLLAVLAVVLAYRWWFASSVRPQQQRRDTFYAEAKPPAQLVFLYMDGCGWCDKFKPHWEAFVAEYGATLADAGVTTASFERKDPASAAFGQVDGYPTVLFAAEDKAPVKFQGDRTPEGLIAFVRENGYASSSSAAVHENYYEEPKTELGDIHDTVKTTKDSNDGKVGDQAKGIQQGAGGNLKATGK
jgi:thiol-disulfide isomerase/thioredoxin